MSSTSLRATPLKMSSEASFTKPASSKMSITSKLAQNLFGAKNLTQMTSSRPATALMAHKTGVFASKDMFGSRNFKPAPSTSTFVGLNNQFNAELVRAQTKQQRDVKMNATARLYDSDYQKSLADHLS